MSRVKKRKSRIKLNETLNRQLDSMEDDSALEVFKPKVSDEMSFYDMINEAVEQEEAQNNNGKKNKKKLKASGRSKNWLSVLLAFVFCSMFVIFIYVLVKIVIL